MIVKNISLRIKTITIVAISTFFIFLLLFLSNSFFSKQRIKRDYYAELEQFKAVAASCLYLPVKEQQMEMVSEIISGLMQNKNAKCIEIYLSNAPKDIFFAKQRNEDYDIKETSIPFVPNRKFISSEIALKSIDITGNSAGIIKFYFETASLLNTFSSNSFAFLTSLFVAWAFLVFFLYIFFNRQFIFPLKRLISGMEDLTLAPIEGRLQLKIFSQNGQKEFELIEKLINFQIKKITGIIEKLESCFIQLKETANKNLKTSLEFEDSANTEACAIEEISATLVESSASILNISTSTHSSAEKLSNSAAKAKDSFVLIDQITMSINDISEQSKKIQNSLSLIYDVTNETEMLAMNASIEAAKAGEFGKGFSVVANEIRQLAEKSQESVADIDEKIKQNNEIVERTQRTVADSQKTLKEILEMTVVSDQFLSQIAVAINETSSGQNELLKAVDNINSAMTKMVSLVGEMKSCAAEIEGMSSSMDAIIRQEKK